MERKFGKTDGLPKSDIRKLKEINTEINDVWNYNKNIDINDMETMEDFCNRRYKFLDDKLKTIKIKIYF